MRVAVASAFSCCIGIWKRLADEGNEVRVWRGMMKDDGPALFTAHRNVGKGIVPLVDSWYELLDWAKTGTRAGIPTIVLVDSSGLGRLADDARRAGVHVVGGGTFPDRLEKDRTFGRDVVLRAGMNVPPFMEFASLSDTLAYARSGDLDRPVYFKSSSYLGGDATHCADTAEELVEYLEFLQTKTRDNIRNILEEKIDGVALSTARWWNGRTWIGPYEWTWERKKFMVGEVGPSTGCSLNAVGFYEEAQPAIAATLNWEAMTPEFLKWSAPPGLYDLNTIVSDSQAYVLEHTSRFGFDSEGSSLTMLYDDFGQTLWNVATGQGDLGTRDGMAVATRLSVPPYPSEEVERDDKASCVGVPVRGEVGDLWSGGFVGYDLMLGETGLEMACAEGIVGLSIAHGDVLSDLAEQVVDFAKERLRVPGLQYRTDVGEVIADDAKRAEQEGFPQAEGLGL